MRKDYKLHRNDKTNRRRTNITDLDRTPGLPSKETFRRSRNSKNERRRWLKAEPPTRESPQGQDETPTPLTSTEDTPRGEREDGDRSPEPAGCEETGNEFTTCGVLTSSPPSTGFPKKPISRRNGLFFLFPIHSIMCSFVIGQLR